MVFENGLIIGEIYIYPRLTTVGMATKFGTKLTITWLVQAMSVRFFASVGDLDSL